MGWLSLRAAAAMPEAFPGTLTEGGGGGLGQKAARQGPGETRCDLVGIPAWTARDFRSALCSFSLIATEKLTSMVV